MPKDRRTWEHYLQHRLAYEQLDLGNICGEWRSPETLYTDIQAGPVIHWLPRSRDIERFVRIAEAVGDGDKPPVILELGAGSGFLSYLLARTERASVVAVEPDEKLLTGDGNARRQDGITGLHDDTSRLPYSHPNLQLRAATSREVIAEYQDSPPDVVLCSWMPARFNFVPDIIKLNPKAIIYVRRDFAFLQSTDRNHKFYIKRFAPHGGYQVTCTWTTPSEGDVIDFLDHLYLWKNSPVIILNDSLVEVHVKSELMPHITPALFESPQTAKYPWEDTSIEALTDKFLLPEAYTILTQDPRYQNQLAFLEEGLAALLAVEPVSFSPSAPG